MSKKFEILHHVIVYWSSDAIQYTELRDELSILLKESLSKGAKAGYSGNMLLLRHWTRLSLRKGTNTTRGNECFEERHLTTLSVNQKKNI
jgi:hypothetical protein